MKALTEVELAYLAGFIDGEGSITIIRTPPGARRGPRYQVRLQIGNTDETVMRWIKSVLGGSMAVRPVGPEGAAGVRHRRRTLYHLCSSSQISLKALRLLLPYLRVKREQAAFAIDFQERFIGPANIRQAKTSEAKLAEMEAAKLVLQAMNQGVE